MADIELIYDSEFPDDRRLEFLEDRYYHWHMVRDSVGDEEVMQVAFARNRCKPGPLNEKLDAQLKEMEKAFAVDPRAVARIDERYEDLNRNYVSMINKQLRKVIGGEEFIRLQQLVFEFVFAGPVCGMDWNAGIAKR